MVRKQGSNRDELGRERDALLLRLLATPPEMIEGGVGTLLCYHREYSDEEDVVREIFCRMFSVWRRYS